MKQVIALRWILFFSLVAGILEPQGLLACPVCYGAADSPMLDGMNVAIMVLLGITGTVLAGIGSFFIMMRKRSKILNDHSAGKAVVDKRGILQWNNF